MALTVWEPFIEVLTRTSYWAVLDLRFTHASNGATFT
jgi:hypothetical protein